MFSLLHAEWNKVLKNHLITAFLVWILPIGIAAVIIFIIILSLISDTMRSGIDAFSLGLWTTDMISIWRLVTSFPGNIFGRMMPLAFMAVGFAGEYQWGTWKNIIPRRRRSALILSKLVVLTVVVMISLVTNLIISGGGLSLAHHLHDIPHSPKLSVDVITDFIRIYSQSALIGLMSVLILGSFAALAAILTKSILGSLLLGFFFSVADAMSLGGLVFLGNLLNRTDLVNLYQYTPSYNLDNLRCWFVSGSAFTIVGPGFTAEPSICVFYTILALWIVGLCTLAIVIFQKQDITS